LRELSTWLVEPSDVAAWAVDDAVAADVVTSGCDGAVLLD